MRTVCKFSDFKVVVQETFDSTKPDLNIILKNGETFLYLKDLDDARDVANVLSVFDNKIKSLEKENRELKDKLNDCKQVKEILLEENKKYSKCPLCGCDLKNYYGK